MTPTLWVEAHKIKNEAGLPIEFKDHYFMMDFYNDMSPLQVMLKAPQIGATVAEIIKSFHCARYKKWDIIYCVDTETKALTNNGFKYYNEISPNDKLLTHNIETGISEWQSIDELFVNDVVTDMYEFNARNFNAFVTSNHRWYVYDVKGKFSVVETNELTKKETFIPKVASLPDTGKIYSNEYVELLAWVFSEGYYCKQKGKSDWSIILSQSVTHNPHRCEEIRSCLKLNGVKWKEYFNKYNNCINFRFAFDLGKQIKTDFPDKIPTFEFAMKLTPNQAYLFCEAFVKGDGWMDNSGTMAITQKNHKSVEVVAMIGSIAGLVPSIVKPYKGSPHGCYTIRFTQFNKVYCRELNPKIHKDWSGRIWCPRVKNGNFFAMRSGRFYLTGNTLPTQGDVSDMAGGKINRIVAQNPVLGEWVKEHDTVEQKSIGDSIIYYRGTYSNKQAMMVSSDLNIHDEVDASDAEVIQQYETRLQAKADGRRWYFSHPSLAGFGVDIPWQLSDKKEWFIICQSCQKEQQLKFPENVDIGQKQYVCQFCKSILSDTCRRTGKWMPTSKGAFSGYHVSQLMCPWISAEKIVDDWENKDKQYFYNYVLGLPYVGSDNKIDPSTVLKNVTDAVNDQEDRIIIGVDTGLPIHYVCLNKQGIFYYGKCKPPSDTYDPYDTIESFLRRWPKSVVVSDQGGDLIGIRKLQAKYPGRVFLCWYRRDKTGKQVIKWGEGDEFGTVIVDRNRMIQLTVEQLRDVGRIRLNGSIEDWKEYANHWGNMYRSVKVNGLGVAEYVWERNGPDHFAHSTVYALVGLDKYATSMATVVQPAFTGDIPQGRIFDNSLNF